MGLHLLVDIALQLCLLLVHIDVVKQRVVTLDTYSHQLWLASMSFTIDMLHNLVIGAQLLFVLSQAAIYTIDGCICHEFLEVSLSNELGDVRVENYIVSHADSTTVVLVVLALTHSVGQAPRGASLAVRADLLPAIWLLDKLVPADIHEGLLVEELLLLVTHHLLCTCLDTEA